MESQKISWPSDQGHRIYIWATCAQKMYPAISSEPLLQFSQKEPHFLKNHKINPIKSWNLKNFMTLERGA